MNEINDEMYNTMATLANTIGLSILTMMIHKQNGLLEQAEELKETIEKLNEQLKRMIELSYRTKKL